MSEQIDSVDLLHRIISPHIGEIRSIVLLGEGLDNVAYLVNEDLIVRRAKTPDPEAIRREVELLAIVGRYSPLPVPTIVFSEPDNGVLAYHALPGRPALDLPDAHRSIDPEPLGRFLAAIHAVPISDVESLVPHDDDPLADWLNEAKEGYEQIANTIPESLRPKIETFLAEQPPPDPVSLVFCHNDLGAEHILVDPATMRITGIIDWTDAAITDPVRDLALIFRDFGPTMLERVIDAYGTELTPEDHQRLVFHARCKLIEDIAYGIETASARYLHAALAHLEWTFA